MSLSSFEDQPYKESVKMEIVYSPYVSNNGWFIINMFFDTNTIDLFDTI